MTWVTIVVAAAGCYLLKLAGLSLPPRAREHPVVDQIGALIPVALLSALVAVQVFADDHALRVDARILGLGFAIAALALRAPFLVVVLGAAAVAALARHS
jgi:branched-subunit amino acid transport protein